MKQVVFIGLGVMGYPMAGILARAGHRVTVFNRTREKAKRWVGEYGGKRWDISSLFARLEALRKNR